MVIRLPGFPKSAQALQKVCPSTPSRGNGVPRGYVPVYVGRGMAQKRRFIVPLAYLNHPCFKRLLRLAEEEFGFEHPMGGLTIPCSEESFIDLIATSLSDECSIDE